MLEAPRPRGGGGAARPRRGPAWPRSSTSASGAASPPRAWCSTSRSRSSSSQDRINDPDRLWIDLDGTRLHPNLVDRSFPVGDGLLEKIRVAQNKDDVVRVVLDFKDVKDHSIFYLQNPTRLVVDVRGAAPPRMASARAGPAVCPIRSSRRTCPRRTRSPISSRRRPGRPRCPAPRRRRRNRARVTAPSPPARLAAWTRHDGTPVTASPSPSPAPTPCRALAVADAARPCATRGPARRATNRGGGGRP